MSCSVFQVSIYGWLSAMDHVGVSGTGESTPTRARRDGREGRRERIEKGSHCFFKSSGYDKLELKHQNLVFSSL